MLGRDLLLEFQSVDVGQLDVEHQAGRQIGPGIGEVFRGGAERHAAEAERFQKLAQRLAHVGIVVDDEDDMVAPLHTRAAECEGRVKLSAVPFGSPLVAHSRPSCASTIERQIASPMPMPSTLVE